MFGPDHPHTLGQMGNLTLVLIKQGKLKEARSRYEQALEIEPRSFGIGSNFRFRGREFRTSLRSSPSKVSWQRPAGSREELLEENWQTVGPCHIETFIAAGDVVEARIRKEGRADVPSCYEEMGSVERGKQISPNIFFLATAHWQLGNKEKARHWYDKAAEWMDKHKPNDKELVPFRDGAAKLISSEDDDKTTDDREG